MDVVDEITVISDVTSELEFNLENNDTLRMLKNVLISRGK